MYIIVISQLFTEKFFVTKDTLDVSKSEEEEITMISVNYNIHSKSTNPNI